jgi:hypothetical protein
MQYDIELADVLAWVDAYEGELFHALLCDPPYHLTSITERFGKPGSAPAQFGTDGAFARASRGFMNATWDGGRIAFEPETWAALGRLLHPGAFGMAFASTRGFHRMAVAIEDAGFIIHPMICWNFASGFPKATRIDVQIDRAAGVERTVVGKKPQTGAKFKLTQELIDNGGFNDPDRDDYDVTEPATPLAQAWEGHRYGMQALKPAIEPIIVFQKRYQGRPVDSITRTGAGALNVDGGRINPGEETPGGGRSWGAGANTHEGWKRPGNQNYEPSEPRTDGRWPANLVLSHTESCNGHCATGCPVAALGEQSGESTGKQSERGTVNIFDELYKRAPSWHGESTVRGHDDSGTAARFFFNADYALDRLEANDPLIYVPKSSTAEREAGLADFSPTTIGDGRTTPIDNAYQRGETSRRNTHPTIKPISLARHLATLLLPPDLYAPRRLLIPFAGAGSEIIGAMLAGWEVVQGVELEEQHVQIARARIAFWKQMRYKLMNPDAPVKVAGATPVPDGQTTLW